MSKYHGRWSSHSEMVNDYTESYNGPPPDGMASEAEVLFASYGGGSYDGDATVIFIRNGDLFEVGGSHCSCNGLEGQWVPARVTWDALAMREVDGDKGYGFLSDHEQPARDAWRAMIAAHRTAEVTDA